MPAKFKHDPPCQERGVSMVSVAYVEMTLTQSVQADKSDYSVHRPDMVQYHSDLKAKVEQMPAWNRKRDGSPPLFIPDGFRLPDGSPGRERPVSRRGSGKSAQSRLSRPFEFGRI